MYIFIFFITQFGNESTCIATLQIKLAIEY